MSDNKEGTFDFLDKLDKFIEDSFDGYIKSVITKYEGSGHSMERLNQNALQTMMMVAFYAAHRVLKDDGERVLRSIFLTSNNLFTSFFEKLIAQENVPEDVAKKLFDKFEIDVKSYIIDRVRSRVLNGEKSC